jgi:hypothetical protein
MSKIYEPKNVMDAIYNGSNIERDSNCARMLKGMIAEFQDKLFYLSLQVKDLKKRVKKGQKWIDNHSSVPGSYFKI